MRSVVGVGQAQKLSNRHLACLIQVIQHRSKRQKLRCSPLFLIYFVVTCFCRTDWLKQAESQLLALPISSVMASVFLVPGISQNRYTDIQMD